MASETAALKKPAPILCYVSGKNISINSQLIAAAQHESNEMNIPFAVVVCVEKNEDLYDLLNFERDLDRYNIPLLTVIGDEAKRLQAVCFHLKPVKMYDSKMNITSAYRIKQQIVAWPGKIASVHELIESNGLAC